MRKYRGIILGVIAGVVLGLIGGPVWIVAPWGAIAVGLAYDSENYKILSSGVFGFAASFFFMLHGYNGTNSLITRVPPFLLIGLFGGGCGMAAGWLGAKISKAKD